MASYSNDNHGDHYSTIDEKNLSNKGLKNVNVSKIPQQTNILLLDSNKLLEFPVNICNPDVAPNLHKLSLCNQLDLDRILEYEKPALQQIPGCISNLDKLSELYLANNDIRTLPDTMATMHNLQTLDLRLNNIAVFPQCICGMKGLKFLNLCGNKLKKLPEEISQLRNLVQLTLIRNEMQSLPDGLSRLKSLEKLELQRNQITYVPKSICDLSTLERNDGLCLTHNPLQHPPSNMADRSTSEIMKYLRHNPAPIMRTTDPLSRRTTAKPTRTTAKPSSASEHYRYPVVLSKQYDDVDLSKQGLFEALPDVDWSKVDKLDVSSNNIVSVKVDLKDLTSLDTLILDNNCIVDSFPLQTIKQMRLLRKLAISKQSGHHPGRRDMDSTYGRLKVFPTDLVFIQHLTHLHMSDNQIQVIPTEIKLMKNLIELDLMDNKYIKTLPNNIACLSNLRYLGLSNNSIEQIPARIGELQQLRVLRLSHNQLQELPDEICDLTQLMTLSLSHNKLIYLPLNFDRLTSLTGNEEYVSELLAKGKFTSSLKLDNNPSLQFPSSECQKYNPKNLAKQIFEDYAILKEGGLETAQEMIDEARQKIQRPRSREIPCKILTDKTFAFLSTKIGHDWKQLGLWLDLSKEELDQCQANNPSRMQDAVVDMFTRWRDHSNNKRKSEGSLVTQLQKAMSETKNEHLRTQFNDYLKT